MVEINKSTAFSTLAAVGAGLDQKTDAKYNRGRKIPLWWMVWSPDFMHWLASPDQITQPRRGATQLPVGAGLPRRPAWPPVELPPARKNPVDAVGVARRWSGIMMKNIPHGLTS